jgi:hypothetical protein
LAERRDIRRPTCARWRSDSRLARNAGRFGSSVHLRDFKAALEEAEEEIGEEGEEGGGDGAGEDEGIADEGDATEDESAKAAGSDGSGDGGDADGDDGGGANTSKNDGESKRETDADEDLRAGHAHGFGGFQDGGIDAGEADVGVAQDGEQCVKDESDDGGALADAADERDGNQEAEEGKAGNSLKDAGDAERDGAQGGPLHNEHAERDADEDGDGHGDEDEREVIESGAQDFGAMRDEKGPGAHGALNLDLLRGLMRGFQRARQEMR